MYNDNGTNINGQNNNDNGTPSNLNNNNDSDVIQGLIKSKIHGRNEDYSLITDNELKAIKKDNTLLQVFIFIDSLLYGAFISTIITLNTIKEKDSLAKLNIYKNFFLVFAIIFSILVIIYKIIDHFNFNKFKKNE